MDINLNNDLMSDQEVLDLHAKWSDEVQSAHIDYWNKNVIPKLYDCDDLDEHPRIKLCNEYLSNSNLLPPKARKSRKNVY